MVPQVLNLVLFRGVHFGPQSIYLTHDNGAPRDLTGYTPLAAMRDFPWWCSRSPVFDLAPALGNASNGEIVIERTSAVTANASCQRGGWDLMLRAPDGEVSGPWAQGNIAISGTYTETV